MKFYPKANIAVSISLIAWLFAVVIGLNLVLSYENTPGRGGVAPTQWPANREVTRTAGMPTLIMMIHPHCPCSRASIGELAILMTEVQGLVNATVVFVRPEGVPAEWEKTDLWSSAAMIPGVRVMVDDAGVEAQLFDSRTSGHVMLYDTDGRLIFNGGITSQRGHSGDNDGRSAIASLLTKGSSGISETPVFGCQLFSEASNKETKDSCDASHSN